MAIAFPCEACGSSLDGGAVNLRFTASAVVSTGAGRSKLVPSGRPAEFLLCPSCARYLEVGLQDVRDGRAFEGVAAADAGADAEHGSIFDADFDLLDATLDVAFEDATLDVAFEDEPVEGEALERVELRAAAG